MPKKKEKERTCRICGCTDNDSRQCIKASGSPCHWVEQDLCSRCQDEIESHKIQKHIIATSGVNMLKCTHCQTSEQMPPDGIKIGEFLKKGREFAFKHRNC